MSNLFNKINAVKAFILGSKEAVDLGLPRQLVAAMDLCLDAPKLRDQRLKELEEFHAELKLDGYSEDLPLVEYEMDLVRWTLDEAYQEAIRRKDYIKSLDTESKRQDEFSKCASGEEGTLHWINTWAWTHDPRMPITSLPFRLYKKQEDYIKWLEKLVFRYQQPRAPQPQLENDACNAEL